MKNDKLYGKEQKADASELSKLRQKVLKNNQWFKYGFVYNCVLLLVFVIMLFPLTYASSLNSGNAASPILIAIAAAVASIPILILGILVQARNRIALFIHLTVMSVLMLIFLIMTCNVNTVLYLILPVLYLITVLSLIYKNKRIVFLMFGLTLIVYLILALNVDLKNRIYPSVLILFSILLDVMSFEKLKDYEALKKIYGFPYFNERFNEQKNEYAPCYTVTDFVSNAPDNADSNKILSTEQKTEINKVHYDMETISNIEITDIVKDVPISPKKEVEEYTEKLRKLKQNKNLKL